MGMIEASADEHCFQKKAFMMRQEGSSLLFMISSDHLCPPGHIICHLNHYYPGRRNIQTTFVSAAAPPVSVKIEFYWESLSDLLVL